jgi:hypothetical protein
VHRHQNIAPRGPDGEVSRGCVTAIGAVRSAKWAPNHRALLGFVTCGLSIGAAGLHHAPNRGSAGGFGAVWGLSVRVVTDRLAGGGFATFCTPKNGAVAGSVHCGAAGESIQRSR